MARICGVIGLIVALGAGLMFFVWRHFGPAVAVTLAPLPAIALARPLLELASELRSLARHRVYREVAGRYFEHRGQAIDIVEDDEGQRWLRIDDLRKIIPGLPRAGVLGRLHPGGVAHFDKEAAPRLRAEDLAEYLRKSTDADSLRLRNWLEREVIAPARHRR